MLFFDMTSKGKGGADKGVCLQAQDDIAVRTHRAAEHFVDQLSK